MRKICIIFLTSIIILLSAVGIMAAPKEQGTGAEYLRIHIRANSNGEKDQAIKYAVRDEVVAYLTPYIADCEDMPSAERVLFERLKGIEDVAEGRLEKAGFFYGAKAEIKTESFPTRVYDGYTLPAGEYRALIVYLGEGTGDNWWCVVYPPLCFSGASNVVYRSKIVEIIQKWQAGTR